MKIRQIILCSLLILPLHAFKNIESSKKEIKATLQITNPKILSEFHNFCLEYDNVVTSFFDTNNHYSLAKHIDLMEKNLITLKTVAENPEFKTVRHILMDLNQQLANLISLLSKYVGSKNSVGLAFKVRNFKNLLPPAVEKKGDFSLWWALTHRLGC